MPGLVGVIDPTQKDDYLNKTLQKMCSLIQHDKSYKIDHCRFKNFASIARVHIGIFNNYKQPLLSKDGLVSVFLEGEIYTENNPDQIEEIERCYRKFGDEFASYLNGSFLTLIHDKTNRKIIIANDRIGSRPLFYKHVGNKLLFAPEVKSLLIDGIDDNEIHEGAIAHFLAMGRLLQNETFFKNIYRLPPASLLIFKDNNLLIKKYWRPFNDQPVNDRSSEFNVNTLSNLINTAVKRRTEDHKKRRIGLSLSGGYDSRGILSACIRNSRSITSLSHGENPKKPYCDIAIARTLSEKSNYKHIYYPLKIQR